MTTTTGGTKPLRFDAEFPTCREGVFTPTGFAGPAEIVDLVVMAENLGYHGVWGTDFVAPQPDYGIPDGEVPDWYELLTTIAYCAARTERIRLGTGLLLAPLRDPVIVAKQVATIDRLSGGRLMLGLGLGMSKQEFRAVRPRMAGAYRGAMLDEFLELLHALIGDDGPVRHDGDHYQVNGVELHPKPLQDPLPTYVPCHSAKSYERVARWGLNITASATSIPRHVAALRPLLEQAGRPPADLDAVAEGEVLFGTNERQAIERYQTTRHSSFRLGRMSLEDFLAANFVGTVEQVIDKMGGLVEQGVDHFYLLHIPADTLTERIELLHRFAEEVMPALGAKTTSKGGRT